MAKETVVMVAHTSDLHFDESCLAAEGGDIGRAFHGVMGTIAAQKADLLLLAGDTFDHNRLPDSVIGWAASVFAATSAEIVVLPGNHDPASDSCPFRHGLLSKMANLHVLGVNRPDLLRFDQWDLEIWGRPHRDYDDMEPLADPPPRAARRRIVMAHGHYETRPDRSARPRPAWLFGDAEIAACEADYVALGHWNRCAKVGAEAAPAWYSGSPDYARSVNFCCFDANGASVARIGL